MREKQKLNYIIIFCLTLFFLFSCADDNNKVTSATFDSMITDPSQIEDYVIFEHFTDIEKNIQFFARALTNIQLNNGEINDVTITSLVINNSNVTVNNDNQTFTFNVSNYSPSSELTFNISLVRKDAKGNSIQKNYTTSVKLPYLFNAASIDPMPNDQVNIFNSDIDFHWNLPTNNYFQAAYAYSWRNELSSRFYEYLPLSRRYFSFLSGIVADLGPNAQYYLMISSFNYNTKGKFAVICSENLAYFSQNIHKGQKNNLKFDQKRYVYLLKQAIK